MYNKHLIYPQDDEEVNSLPSSTGATAGGDGGGIDSDERIVYLQRRTDRSSRLQARLQVSEKCYFIQKYYIFKRLNVFKFGIF
jgi:hypothetical protein